jgi:twitching motility protein PilT
MTHEQLLNLLTLGVKKGASDIHLEAGYAPVYRINGELFQARLDKLTPQDTEEIARDILGKDDPFFAGKQRDVDRGFGIAGLSRFRASILRQRSAVGLVLRVIPFDVPSMSKLNLPEVLNTVADIRSGLVLVTGATGNGKSTTIAALLDAINRKERLHVITVEDPIEYIFQPDKAIFVQREVGSDTDDFTTAMRAALRQDPDVIMVGEMRDRQTAEIALKAAETGHLLISSLHTTDTVRSVGRLIGMFAPEEQLQVRYRLAETLKAVVSLRLLPRSDVIGQTPAVEVMLVTRSIQECIRDPMKSDQFLSLIEKGRDDLGMQCFDQHLIELCKKGWINIDIAKSHATRPADVERELMLEGGS